MTMKTRKNKIKRTKKLRKQKERDQYENSHWMKEIKKANSAKPRNERKDKEKAKN